MRFKTAYSITRREESKAYGHSFSCGSFSSPFSRTPFRDLRLALFVITPASKAHCFFFLQNHDSYDIEKSYTHSARSSNWFDLTLPSTYPPKSTSSQPCFRDYLKEVEWFLNNLITLSSCRSSRDQDNLVPFFFLGCFALPHDFIPFPSLPSSFFPLPSSLFSFSFLLSFNFSLNVSLTKI